MTAQHEPSIPHAEFHHVHRWMWKMLGQPIRVRVSRQDFLKPLVCGGGYESPRRMLGLAVFPHRAPLLWDIGSNSHNPCIMGTVGKRPALGTAPWPHRWAGEGIRPTRMSFGQPLGNAVPLPASPAPPCTSPSLPRDKARRNIPEPPPTPVRCAQGLPEWQSGITRLAPSPFSPLARWATLGESLPM